MVAVVLVVEETASAIVLDADGRVGLIRHPRLDEWMPPGGHREKESGPDAAEREVAEELGVRIRFIAPPGSIALEDFPRQLLPTPWWLMRFEVPADNHTRERHVHLDHVFVAVSTGVVGEPAHPVRWFTEGELAETADVAEDSRLQIKEVFARIAELQLAAA